MQLRAFHFKPPFWAAATGPVEGRPRTRMRPALWQRTRGRAVEGIADDLLKGRIDSEHSNDVIDGAAKTDPLTRPPVW
jgi:hypothetical protein